MITRFFEKHDSTGVQKDRFLKFVREGKSLSQLQAVLESYGLIVDRSSISKYIQRLSPEIKDQREIEKEIYKKILGIFDRILWRTEKLEDSRKTDSLKILDKCPSCGMIFHSIDMKSGKEIYVSPKRFFDMGSEMEIIACPNCGRILMKSDENVNKPLGVYRKKHYE